MFEPFSGNLDHDTLMTDCKDLLRHFLQDKVTHCFHEANLCVDAMAGKEPNLIQDFVVFVPYVRLCRHDSVYAS